MASVAGSTVKIAAGPRFSQRSKALASFSGQKLVSFSGRKSFTSLRLQHLQICGAAKPETLQKVCEIVKKQLALADTAALSGESKFSDLGADSLDTVEIVMGLEEAFGISVEEDSAQSIATVQDAADLIEDIVSKS